MMQSKCKWVRLGDYIEQCDERNTLLQYKLDDVMGMTIAKDIIPTKANLKGNDLSKFKIVYPDEFVYNPRTHGKKIGLGINVTSKPFLISWNNIAFRIINKELLPLYLYLFICREEWDRLACFNSWGSSTEVFAWDEFCRMAIPLPSLAEQQKVVNAWKALREIKEQNEAVAAPLMQVCQSYIQELKHQYESVEIGQYIEESNERNSEEKYGIASVRGLAVSKGMIKTKANMKGVSLKSYKVVKPREIAFVPDTSRRGDKMSLGMNSTDNNYLVSSISCVFRILDTEKLLADFLYLIFCRPEFDRYARFNSWGSARETFTWEDMKRVRIPLPPLSVQQAIVNIYNCANEAKRIAAEADRMSREVCPALIQHVIHY